MKIGIWTGGYGNDFGVWDINLIMECKKKAVLRIGQYCFRCYKLVVLSFRQF